MLTRVMANLTISKRKNNIPYMSQATITPPKSRVERKKLKLFITIPELLPSFPFSPRQNWPEEGALAENIEWLTSFGFPVEPSYAELYGMRYALTMPKVDKEHCVLLLNMMAVLAITEGLTDDMCASDVERVRDVMENIMKLVRVEN